MRRLARAILVAVLGVGTAASSLGCGPVEKKNPSGPLQYSENARRAYEEAMTAFKDRDWLEATNLFREVRRRFAFSNYAPLAQLRMAGINYEQDKWVESISAYKAFVRENPKHPDLGWARMRIARCYYNQISDALLLPPQEERDQSAVIEAAREIQSYLSDFPEGPQRAEMKELGADALARLVGHELYVARFYLAKSKLDAALSRVTYAVQRFKGSSRDVEALVLQGEVLLMLKRRAEARDTFELVLKRYPNDPQSTQAKKFLAKMDADPN